MNNLVLKAQYNGFGQLRHLLTLDQMPAELMQQLLDRAQALLRADHGFKQSNQLQDKLIISAFFENSTRTRVSFAIAAAHLGAKLVNFDVATSSTHKGESTHDTIMNLLAMAPDYLIIRHASDDLLTDNTSLLNDTPIKLINAGIGCSAHPTQALLDMLTIRQHKPNFTDLRVAIMGDIKHSRVAHSQLLALRTLGVSDIRLIAPSMLNKPELATENIQLFDRPEDGLRHADVIINLRIQRERLQQAAFADQDYFTQYGLNQTRLALAADEALVMHPGPLNRQVEIANDVADGPQSVILQQVKNGVAMRMAILQMLNETVNY